MNYSTEQLLSIADCDAVLLLAAQEQASLQQAQQADPFPLPDDYHARIADLNADLASTTIAIETTMHLINTLAAEPEKDAALKKHTKLEYRKTLLLSNINETMPTIALLEKDLALMKIEKELVKLQQYIEQVNILKAGF